MIVADTNVVSEVMRADPDANVLRWMESIAPGGIGITAVTVEEIERGIGRLAPGRRRRDLDRRWRAVISDYGEDVLAYGVAEAVQTADVLVGRERAGRPMHLADAMIAGICLVGSHTLATRNTSDFDGIPDLVVHNPFVARPKG